MRQVRIDIANETVRARRGALSNMFGSIQLVPNLPGAGDVFRSLFNSEARVRPYYSGTGTILLQPSLGGYHLLQVRDGEQWILEPGIYWASEGSVRLGFYKERTWPSLWAGDGPFAWKTVLSGSGMAAINAPGPVEMIDIDDAEMRVQGRLVLGRTRGLRFTSRRAARFPRNLISGQRRLRVFTGTGRLMVCWTPYWNEHLYRRMTGGESITGSLLE